MSETTIDTIFEQGIHAASAENYLGDPVVVQSLLRDLAVKCLKRFDVENPKPSAEQDIADCLSLADVFLGKSPDYTPVPDWNLPGHICAYLKAKTMVTGDTPEQITASVLASFVSDVYQLYNYAVDGMLEENWSWQIDALCDHYSHLLIGVQLTGITPEGFADQTD